MITIKSSSSKSVVKNKIDLKVREFSKTCDNQTNRKHIFSPQKNQRSKVQAPDKGKSLNSSEREHKRPCFYSGVGMKKIDQNLYQKFYALEHKATNKKLTKSEKKIISVSIGLLLPGASTINISMEKLFEYYLQFRKAEISTHIFDGNIIKKIVKPFLVLYGDLQKQDRRRGADQENSMQKENNDDEKENDDWKKKDKESGVEDERLEIFKIFDRQMQKQKELCGKKQRRCSNKIDESQFKNNLYFQYFSLLQRQKQEGQGVEVKDICGEERNGEERNGEERNERIKSNKSIDDISEAIYKNWKENRETEDQVIGQEMHFTDIRPQQKRKTVKVVTFQKNLHISNKNSCPVSLSKKSPNNLSQNSSRINLNAKNASLNSSSSKQPRSLLKTKKS